MRLLDSSAALVGIEGLGYDADQQALLMHAISRPYGMVLVTGPTGSGKTVSLYSFLQVLNQPGVNISTAEDPAEISLPGGQPGQRQRQDGLHLRARPARVPPPDPDIIMVGEIATWKRPDIGVRPRRRATWCWRPSTPTTRRRPDAGWSTWAWRRSTSPPAVNLSPRSGWRASLCTHCKHTLDIPHEALVRAGFPETDLTGSGKHTARSAANNAKAPGTRERVGIFEVLPISEEMTGS